MIPLVARKELVDTVRDGRFRWGGLIVLSLLLVALASGWAEQRDIAATHAAAEDRTWTHWLEQGERNPHSAAHYGIYAFKPVTALSLVDPGVDPYVGVATWLEAHRQNPFEYRPAQDGASASRLGILTAAGVLQLLVPLLIILFAFSAISGEREGGTLRQLLSVGLSPRQLVWGKALGVAGALAVLLVPAALVGALALALGPPEAEPAGLARVGLLAAGYAVYFGAFVALTLAASAWAPSSRAALVGLLAFWVVNGLVAPRAAAELAEAIHPLPSSVEFEASIERSIEYGLDGRTPQGERLALLQDSVLRAHGAESPAELPVNVAGLFLQAEEEYGNRVFDLHYGDLHGILDRHEWVHRAVALVAPLLAVRSVSMGLAGTDLGHHRRFQDAAEAHRRAMQRVMNDDLTQSSRWGEEYEAGPDLWAQVPRFEYRVPGASWALARQRTPWAILLLWLGLALVLLRLASSRVRAA